MTDTRFDVVRVVHRAGGAHDGTGGVAQSQSVEFGGPNDEKLMIAFETWATDWTITKQGGPAVFFAVVAPEAAQAAFLAFLASIARDGMTVLLTEAPNGTLAYTLTATGTRP